MTPDKSHSNTVGRVANKVRVEGGENYFYVPKNLWRTSCARDFLFSHTTYPPSLIYKKYVLTDCYNK